MFKISELETHGWKSLGDEASTHVYRRCEPWLREAVVEYNGNDWSWTVWEYTGQSELTEYGTPNSRLNARLLESGHHKDMEIVIGRCGMWFHHPTKEGY